MLRCNTVQAQPAYNCLSGSAAYAFSSADTLTSVGRSSNVDIGASNSGVSAGEEQPIFAARAKPGSSSDHFLAVTSRRSCASRPGAFLEPVSPIVQCAKHVSDRTGAQIWHPTRNPSAVAIDCYANCAELVLNLYMFCTFLSAIAE